ncbi:hypothetical protein HFK89_03670 [Ralstonia pseudosolanacearum]|uniref:hypothetical protein n=1 Tax=Ralstonia pseudosolanacearum TaxID=1310165 RepID=UPI0009BD6C60|nr:hypothetical protein [Ralstonia pseudosolanacearum]MCK4161564.1 hypothetical protein [Ralstonia pseudosolanacearum]
MTDDQAEARIHALYEEAAAVLTEQGLSPIRAYCLVLEWVTVRHEPTLKLLAEAAAHDGWFREEVQQGLEEASDPGTQWVSHEQVKADMAAQREALLRSLKDKGK